MLVVVGLPNTSASTKLGNPIIITAHLSLSVVAAPGSFLLAPGFPPADLLRPTAALEQHGTEPSDKGKRHSCSVAAGCSNEIRITSLSRAREPDPGLNHCRQQQDWEQAVGSHSTCQGFQPLWFDGEFECSSKVASITHTPDLVIES